jgi:hypothetical protein
MPKIILDSDMKAGKARVHLEDEAFGGISNSGY